MKMRRMFAALLVAALLLSVLPTHVLRVSAVEEKIGGLFLDKTATLTDNGTYTIDLEAYATGTPVKSTVTEGIPLDIVLVIDQSGSVQKQGYLASLRDAVTKFVESIEENGELFNLNHRVAITTFSNNGEGSQSGSTALSEYTYVGKKDPSWANTGLFKNDGTYENYGTAVYVPLTEESIDRNNYYYIQVEAKDGGEEWVQLRYSGYYGGWYYFSGTEDSVVVVADDSSELWDTYGSVNADESKLFIKNSYTENLDNNDYAAAWMNVGVNNEVNPYITNAIESFASNGSTYTSYGMIMAKNALDNLPKIEGKRNQLVVVFTDGQPGFGGFESEEANAALAVSADIKQAGADVYTIGLYSSADTNTTTFMNYLSSNYGAVYNMDGDIATYTAVTSYSTPSFYSNSTKETSYYAKDGDAYYTVSVTRSGTSGSRKYEWHYTDGTGTKKTICTTQSYDGDPTLYTKSVKTGEKLSDKYYQTTADMTKLNEIFQTITVDSTTTDTTIALGVDAILKDVLAIGFALTKNTVITVKTQAGSYSGDLGAFELTKDEITWGTVETVATLNYAPGNNTVTQKGYTITVTDSTVTTHGSSIDVTGFNYNEKYICNGHPGSRLLVTITGIEADASLATRTEVYTNHGSSGIYEPADSDVDNDGIKGEAQGSFESPTTYFNYVSYVMDYAKPMTPSTSGANLSEVISANKDGYHYFNPAVTGITDQYGKVSIANNAFTYEPITMNWNGYDSFFLFGKTDNATIKDADANANGNVWSKVTVIPANNVYYEDTFIEVGTDGEKPTWSNVIVGIEYTGSWTTQQPGSNTENPENGENAEEDNQGGVHGWEDSLADDKGYSDGTAAVGGNGATATFTFTGTGVDIYSRTNMKTGLIMASLYAGNAATGTPLRTLVIDNFAKSGDYYMIPTLSIHQLMKRDTNNVPVKDADGNYVYTAMTYGTYTVKLKVISVTNDPDMDGTETTRSTYYLDGIRVYNPVAVDSTVKDAYGDDELNATFTEVRDILLDAKNFWDSGEGPVFIDQIPGENGNTTTDIGVYKDLGPENEVYLSRNQVIVFAPDKGAKYYVGLKSPTGEPVDVVLTTAAGPTTVTISHTTDLYYEVAPYNGMITLGNNEDADLLAITKIKVAGPQTQMETFAMFRSVSREEVLSAAGEAYAAANEPETPDVEIENPEVEEPTPDPSEQIRELIKRLFENLWGWFH